MKRRHLSFHGIGAAVEVLLSPGGQIDLTAMEFHVKKLVAGGVNFLIPPGVISSTTLGYAERAEMTALIVDKAGGEAPVLADTSSNRTAEAVSLTQMAQSAGARGALQAIPYHVNFSPARIRAHFREIAKAGLPVVMRDNSDHNGDDVMIRVILDLAREGTICGLVSNNLNLLQEVLAWRLRDFIILSRHDTLTYPAMCLPGVVGGVSRLANIMPTEMVALALATNIDHHVEGQLLYSRLFRLMQAMADHASIVTALAMIYPDHVHEEFRLPLIRMGQGSKQRLRMLLEEHHLLKTHSQAPTKPRRKGRIARASVLD